MSENEIKVADNNTTDIIKENAKTLLPPEGFQKYILGTKKDGNPRAVYDCIRDYTNPKKDKKKKKHKKNKNNPETSYAFYVSTKKKKKKKKDKHWHI